MYRVLPLAAPSPAPLAPAVASPRAAPPRPRGEDIVEEGAPHGEYTAVEGDGRPTIGHLDVGVAAVEVLIDEEPLEVFAEPVQPHRLHVAAAPSSSATTTPPVAGGQRGSLGRPRRWERDGAGAGSVGQVR